MTAIPGDIKGYASAAANNCIYIIGGYRDGQYIDEVNIYDLSAGEWSTGTPLNKKRAQAAAVCLDNKLYVFGGRNKFGFLSDFGEQYDFATNTWSYVNISENSPLIRAGAQIQYVNGMLCISGGMNTDFEYAGVSFISAFDLNDVRETVFEGYEDISVGVTDAKAIIFAAPENSMEYEVKEAYIADNSVEITDAIPAAYSNTVKYADYVIYNGYIYCMGGYSGEEYLNTVYRYNEYYGEYTDMNGYITGEIADTGNVLTFRAEEDKEYVVNVNVIDSVGLSGYTYKLEYSPDAFELKDGCGATSEWDKTSNRSTGTSIRMGEIADGSVEFTTTEEVPAGMKVSGTINTVILNAKQSGIFSIKYTMIKN
ncbi:MAG: Kelch repeat-containing protein [Candidatus Ornithomonoglobus sp.]